jgi:hypothetical protein
MVRQLAAPVIGAASLRLDFLEDAASAIGFAGYTFRALHMPSELCAI